MDDLDEFITIVGTEVPIYRKCRECDELYVVNPDTYEKPKCECDPGFCAYSVPLCLCTGEVLYDEDMLEACTYPDCECGNE